MMPIRRAAVSFVALLAALASAIAVPGAAAAAPDSATTPAPVSLLYARAFTLEQGYRFEWCAEHPWIAEGTLLVLEADPSLLRARAMAAPVLYVGDSPVERLDPGDGSGRILAIVPGHPPLGATPIWLGTPALPETVDRATARAELSRAREAGIDPPDASSLAVALRRGGATLSLPDRDALRPHLEALLREFAPAAGRRIQALAVPVEPSDPEASR